jgi:hypothetical protein
MAKKRPAKMTAKMTKKTETKPQEEQIVLGANAEKALKLIDKSAKVCDEIEETVSLAVAKALQKVMKANKIELTAAEADLLAGILFGD